MRPGTKVKHKRTGKIGEVKAEGLSGWITVKWEGQQNRLESLPRRRVSKL